MTEAIESCLPSRTPIGNPSRPKLRFHFWARKHSTWGAAVCWYEWTFWGWGVRWGVACETLREAKQIRRFLNARVQRCDSQFGLPFETVAQVAGGSSKGVTG
jgi:hypothetical protein